MEKLVEKIVDPKRYTDMNLLGADIMRAKKESAKKKIKQEEIRSEFSIGELKRFAQMTIEERMKFCREFKKGESFETCVCESIERWIRLFSDYPMQGSKELGKARVTAVQKLFEEMKKEGKFKYMTKEDKKNE